ncbi:tetratricopeptide repeat protein [Morganella sp. GD04133]|uniref:tetratricopeptide repeat protein n=1 Tax=Morganella sp. GD04133 TaxID=2975435 RepID=UPI00244867E3|nr:tetratricopeptide repeat protein [Morganella sp. GD04133]MDH0356637.1 sel1 repeat family protein [Morganella sp. GD04133]
MIKKIFNKFVLALLLTISFSTLADFNSTLKAAEQGDAKAQNNLGLMYYNGEGVQQDDFKAFEWYTKAAEQGDAKAQFNLGLMYDNGEGVQQDDVKAFEWYTKAAE